MKNSTILYLLLSVATYSQGQTNSEKFANQVLGGYATKQNIKDDLIKNDFSALFTKTENTVVLGFIGDNYQRIRIKLISVIKNNNNPSQYFVYGKSMVKDNVCEFLGTLEITKAFYIDEDKDLIGEDSPAAKQGFIMGEYLLYENPNQKHVGLFRGIFRSDWYINKKDGTLKYDDLMIDADGFSNNQFVGTWSNYLGNILKKCNWGDYRIPMSGDLDGGAGEFYPDQKYIANGWQNYMSAYSTMNDKTEAAKKREQQEWWK